MKSIFSLAIVLMLSISAYSQKVELLYFKANLSCCRAAACNTLEAEIKTIVEDNFNKNQVKFKEVKIEEEANKQLVEKYNAKSQTVVLVKYSKRKVVKFDDITEDVRKYNLDKDKNALQNSIKSKINQLL